MCRGLARRARPRARPPSWRSPGVGWERELGPRRDLLRAMDLQHRIPVLAGADAYRLLHRDHEDLAVAERTRAGVLQDHLRDHAHVLGLDHDLELELRPQVDGQLGAPVVLRDALLPARALVLGDRQTREALLQQLHPNRLEGLVANERLYFLH